jgi:TonB-linked SusC/RagA family outer membrane protein
LNINNSNYNTLQIESYLTYNWKNDVHDLTVMAGNSVSREFGNWDNATGSDFPGDNIRDISLTNDPSARISTGAYNLEIHSLSYFGRFQYSYKGRYILTGTARRDGSSRFGVDNTWGTFPSAAAAWRVSEESFMKSIPTISNLKLRLGWGQTGNSGNQNSDQAVNALTSNKVQYNYYSQNGVLGVGSSSKSLQSGTVQTLADTRLKWETNEQKNIGIDLGLLKNSLNITVDYFTRNSKDLLNYLNIRPSSGYNTVYTNIGGIDNKGYEFSINYTRQINQDWNIGVTATGSHVKNKVTGMVTDAYFQNTTGKEVGKIGTPAGTHWDNHSIMRNGYAVGSFYGYKVDHVYKDQAEVDAANAAANKIPGHTGGYNNANGTVGGDYKYKDLNGNGYLDSGDMTILGDGFPKLTYGLTFNASYKNWDFMIYGYGVYGVQIYSYSAMTLTDMFPSDNGTTPNVLNDVAQNAWTPTNNTNAKYARLSFLDLNNNMRGSDAWLKKGDYFKISNVQVGYTFDRNMLKVVRLQSARIYASVQNLVTFSSYNKYGDPEIGQGVLFNGLDTGRYPMPRVYSMGLNIQF